MRVLEATANTVEAIRKAWELRHDLTRSQGKNYSLAARSRSSANEYSGEFAVRAVDQQYDEDGKLVSFSMRIFSGLYPETVVRPAGRVLLAGRVLMTIPYLIQTISSEDYNLDNPLFLWFRLDMTYSQFAYYWNITESGDPPEVEGDEYKTNIFTLIAVIRNGEVFQANYGPILITDRYYDETITEETDNAGN